MYSDHLILMPTQLPPGDDAGIVQLLELAAATLNTPWVLLELQHQGKLARFEHGSPPQGSGTTIDLPLDGSWSARLSYSSSSASPPALRSLLAFALGKTLQIRLLHGQAMLLRGALDTTSSAVLLFDPHGQILYANPPADQLLSRQTEDNLLVELPEEQPQPLFTLLCTLAEEIARRGDTEPRWHGTLAVSDDSVLCCEIIRMRVASGQRANVLAILQEIDALPDRSLRAFVSSHQLTPREQEVLRLLLEGLRTNAMAERLGISPHTVRDHLKNLYRKTATGSRSELLNLVSRATSAPPLETG